jgi:hypothetical protein
MRPYLEKPLHKNRAGGVVQGVGSEFKPQYPTPQKESNQSNQIWFNNQIIKT